MIRAWNSELVLAGNFSNATGVVCGLDGDELVFTMFDSYGDGECLCDARCACDVMCDVLV